MTFSPVAVKQQLGIILSCSSRESMPELHTMNTVSSFRLFYHENILPSVDSIKAGTPQAMIPLSDRQAYGAAYGE